MSHSSVAKRKHPPARADPSKRTRSASSPVPSDDLALLDLESQVHHLGAKVFAFRQKGLPFFARLSQERAQPNPEGEGKVDTAPTESKNAQEDLRQVLKERLAAANLMLPTLLEELMMWNTKIHQAVDVKRKDQRLPFLDEKQACPVQDRQFTEFTNQNISQSVALHRASEEQRWPNCVERAPAVCAEKCRKKACNLTA